MATIGQQIDHYRIERLLGEGGMASVYLAKDLNLQREIALKVMSAQFAGQKQFQLRFIQEARAAAELDHTNIVKIYGCDIKDGQLFIAMEYIPGGSLHDYIQKNTQGANQLDLEITVEMIRQVAEALHYAHQRQMVHRDIKPGNILLKEVDGETGPKKLRPVLTDFGLAKLTQGSMLDTALGESMGTPEYMSPEQCNNQKVDGRSDIYALGVVLYEMVTGSVPFPFRNMHDAIRDHTQTPVPNIQKQRKIDVELEHIILTCLEKDPRDRYQSARELARALEQFQNREPAGDVLMSTQIVEETPAVYAGPVNIVVKDGGREDTRYFDQDTITIGRHDDQNLKLVGDKRVSRRHARITRTPQAGYLITDLGSGNGTQLNDQPLVANTPTPLPLGAVVEVGPCTLRLEKAEPRQQAATDFDPLLTRLDDLPAAAPPAAAAPPKPSAMPPTRASSAYETGQFTPPPIPPTRVNPNPQPEPPRTRVNPNPNPQPPAMPSSPLDPSQNPIHVTTQTRTIMVTTGIPTPFTLTVLNQSQLVDHFKIHILGIPPEWYKVQTDDLRLMPGKSDTGVIQFIVPQASSSTAGEHPIELRITARTQNLNPWSETLILMVQPFYGFETDLKPKLVKRRGRTTLTITNKGNSNNTFNLSANDPAHDLDFDMGPRQVTLKPGEVLQVPIKVTPKQRPLLGSPQQKPFEIGTTTSTVERPPMPQNGTLVVNPIIPRWLLMLIPLLLLLCAALALFALNRTEQQAVTATAAAAAATTVAADATSTDVTVNLTATAAADPDEDGLTTAEEENIGTDPFNPDTDGDGLLDGEEVNEYGTQPRNRDTDGDTLEDGAEVETGCLSPTLPDTDTDGMPDAVEVRDGDPCTQPTLTPTPRPTIDPVVGCAASPPPRLKVGDRGKVEEGGVPNRFRPEPNTDSELIEPPLQPGSTFTVVGGPQCNQAEDGPLIRFWQVNDGRRTGWTAEGWLDDPREAEDDGYYLVPEAAS